MTSRLHEYNGLNTNNNNNSEPTSTNPDIRNSQKFLTILLNSCLFNSETNDILHKAGGLITKILLDDKVKQSCDTLLLGTLIWVMIKEDKDYGSQKCFGNKALYPFKQDISKLTNLTSTQTSFEDKVKMIGSMVINKKLPFDASRVKEVFLTPYKTQLDLSEDYFNQYDNNIQSSSETTLNSQTPQQITMNFFQPPNEPMSDSTSSSFCVIL